MIDWLSITFEKKLSCQNLIVNKIIINNETIDENK